MCVDIDVIVMFVEKCAVFIDDDHLKERSPSLQNDTQVEPHNDTATVCYITTIKLIASSNKPIACDSFHCNFSWSRQRIQSYRRLLTQSHDPLKKSMTSQVLKKVQKNL